MELNLDLRLIFAILNGRVTSAIARALQHDFSESGISISVGEWIVLLYLSECEGVSQNKLCADTYTDKPTMSRLLQSMEKKGYVKRSKESEDRRTNKVILTFSGRLMKNKAAKVADTTLRHALRGLGRDALVTSQDVLRRIFNNTIHNTPVPSK